MKKTRRVALYARLSITSEESVSIARQLNAGRKYAESRGWEIAGEFVDDGVSATANAPEDRPGWRSLLDSSDSFDAVVIWKLDRLARRVLDFMHADRDLQARGAGIVAVEDPVDMTTPQGRAFAQILAVFAEMEAAAISARVSAARAHIVSEGRWAGGAPPYGWRKKANPAGAGFVLEKDPERIEWVVGMASRALRGDTLYSIVKWLDAEGAPLPAQSQTHRKREGWNYYTVNRLLHNPVLGGMTPRNPGRGRHDPADWSAVLRDDSGMPVVDPKLAILTTEEFRELVDRIDNRDTPQARPRSAKSSTSPLLSRLVRCDACDVFMSRGTNQGRSVLTCTKCHQTLTRTQLDPWLVARLLDERGDEPIIEATRAARADTSVVLSDIEDAIRDTLSKMGEDGADVVALTKRLEALKEDRARARATTTASEEWAFTGQTVREAWDASEGDDLARREVLASQVATLRVRRGVVGRRFDDTRVLLEWQPSSADHFPTLNVRR